MPRRLGLSLLDFIVSLAVVLLVAKLFEMLVPEGSVAQALHATEAWQTTIKNYDTWNVVRTFLSEALYLKHIIQAWLSSTMGPASELIESVSYLLIVIIGAVPITIVSLARQANSVLDWIGWSVFTLTVMSSWAWLLAHIRFYYHRRRRKISWTMATIVALLSICVASTIFAAMQWAAYLSLSAFGWAVRLSEAVGYGTFILWGFQEYTKHSITEAIIHRIRAALSPPGRSEERPMTSHEPFSQKDTRDCPASDSEKISPTPDGQHHDGD